MKKIYYLFSFAFIFMSLHLGFAQTGCNVLEITAVEDASIICWGSVMLEAEGTGANGTNIYWYESETSEEFIGTGSIFVTPELSQTTSYWVAEVFLESNPPSPGDPLPTYCPPSSGGSGCNLSDYINDFILEDGAGNKLIEHLGTGCSPGAYGDYTGDASLTASLMAGSTYNFNVTHGTTSQYVRIWIDFDGNGSFEDADELVYTSTVAGSTSAPTIGSFVLPQDLISLNTVMRVRNTWSTGSANSCTQQGGYGEVHDYKVSITGNEVICESPRKEVVVEATTDPDEVVVALPYSHTENTGTYGHLYGGTPGDNCGIEENYLDGNAAVYTYTATEDDLITIKLTDLVEFYAGVFVYDSCNEIGEECLVGAVAGASTDDVIIKDFPVEDGKTYYIVISSWSTNNIDYTLKIDGFSCSDLETPDGDATQQFVAGDTVDDLIVKGTRIGAILTWYEDAGLTQEIVDPSTHSLVDGDKYYVTQTVLDCESESLTITAEEVDCSNLEITAVEDGSICGEGLVTLQATGSGTGDDIIWYDAPTGGSIVGSGPVLQTSGLTTTTSYWVSEVLTKVGNLGDNPLSTDYCTPTFGSGCGFDDVIDDFILEDNNGNPLISHLGTGCSSNAYGDYTDDSSLTTTLSAGQTYNFEVTHGNTTAHYVRVWIDFDGNGSFEDDGELVYEATSPGDQSNPSIGSFTMPQYIPSQNTVMRVKTTRLNGNSNSCTQSHASGEAHDYKVSLIGAELFCESPRKEVVVTVSQDGDETVGPLPYSHTENTATYGNNYSGTPGNACGINQPYLNGNDVVYVYEATRDDLISIELSGLGDYYAGVFIYNSCNDIGIACMAGKVAGPSTDDVIITDFAVEENKVYYIVVSSWLTSSIDYTINISYFDCSTLEPPTGDAIQEFVAGDTVADLIAEETRNNSILTWYSDVDLNNEITDPSVVDLVNGTTYYITQTFNNCESPALEIKAEEFDCDDLEIEDYTAATVVCRGSVTLTADASGTGSEIYWYDAETDGNVIGTGKDFITPELTQTTSYWAAEVFIKQGSIGNQPLPSCESPRQEIIATVDQSGDISVAHTDLPYVDANTTSIYGNNFSGDAGDGCDGANFLNGNETIYYYQADPNNDDVLTIQLMDVNNPNAAVFVYESCDDIGNNCLAGAQVINNNAVIDEYLVEAGQDILIVVSTSSGMVDYSLSIENMDCANIAVPYGEVNPYFATGDVVADLKVIGSSFNDGFRWYSDAALTNEITDPTTEVLVDGISYYVTQTILGCESAALEIIPMEFECNLMGVTPKEEEVYVCAPGGLVTLEVTPSGIGSEVFWYDAETGDNIVGKGKSFTVNATSSTSYWATEVFTKQGTVSGDSLPTYCTPSFNSGCGSSDFIDDFILKDKNNTKLINHISSGCSTNAYGNYTNDNGLTTSLVGGETYYFEATHGTTDQYLRIWIDFNGNGSFEDEGELIYVATSPASGTLPSIGNFTLPQNITTTRNTVMRVKTTYSTGASNSCTQSTIWGEVHDYKVTLLKPSVICESPRTEVKVILNDLLPMPPVVTPLQKICGDGLLSDILVLGDNIQWYNANGEKLNLNSPILEGERYYITQTIKGCESAMEEVIMNFNDKSEEPVAAVNQAFETGESLHDLTVHGDNLRWYKDRFKTESLPENTKLVDQTTYYVTQELEDFCESTPLGITVHEVLDVKDQLFEYFEFYPNPVEDILYITNSETIEQIEIFDLAGRKVVMHKSNASDLKLNVEELSTGTYLLKAKVDGMEKVFRIIKK